MDRNVVVEMVSYDLDLLEHPIDQSPAVTGAEEQSFDARPQEAAVDLEVRTATVLLGVET